MRGRRQAAGIDRSEQVRAIEIADNRDGTASTLGTVGESAAPVSWNGSTTTALALAALSLELAANDPQETARSNPARDGLRGGVQDRDVELLLPTPAAFQARHAARR